MSRIEQVAEDVTELKVMVAKIITTLEHQQKLDDGRDKALEKLQNQMGTALIPIFLAKMTAAIAGGVAVIVGAIKSFSN